MGIYSKSENFIQKEETEAWKKSEHTIGKKYAFKRMAWKENSKPIKLRKTAHATAY